MRDAEPFRLQRFGADILDVVLEIRVGGDQLPDVPSRTGHTNLTCSRYVADVGVLDEC